MIARGESVVDANKNAPAVARAPTAYFVSDGTIFTDVFTSAPAGGATFVVLGATVVVFTVAGVMVGGVTVVVAVDAQPAPTMRRAERTRSAFFIGGRLRIRVHNTIRPFTRVGAPARIAAHKECVMPLKESIEVGDVVSIRFGTETLLGLVIPGGDNAWRFQTVSNSQIGIIEAPKAIVVVETMPGFTGLPGLLAIMASLAQPLPEELLPSDKEQLRLILGCALNVDYAIAAQVVRHMSDVPTLSEFAAHVRLGWKDHLLRIAALERLVALGEPIEPAVKGEIEGTVDIRRTEAECRLIVEHLRTPEDVLRFGGGYVRCEDAYFTGSEVVAEAIDRIGTTKGDEWIVDALRHETYGLLVRARLVRSLSEEMAKRLYTMQSSELEVPTGFLRHQICIQLRERLRDTGA